jgi:molybdate transport system permease protein
VIVAESFVAMPFFVITVESGLRSMNRRLEDAARSLGASRWMVFRRVTLPLIWPSLAAGTVLTWARALGEFGATITFAGNLPGVTQTMPLAIYISQSSGKMDEAIALSLVLVAASLVVMIFRRRISGGD